jgi:hypothetical protein
MKLFSLTQIGNSDAEPHINKLLFNNILQIYINIYYNNIYLLKRNKSFILATAHELNIAHTIYQSTAIEQADNEPKRPGNGGASAR